MKKAKLAVLWRPGGISLLLFEKSAVLKYESILLREAVEEVLASRIRLFLGGHKPGETLLILPRSEVLQKEMPLSKLAGSPHGLETQLMQLLPYSPKEMAYGIAVDLEEPAPSKGLLYAIPEKKLLEILGGMTKTGLSIDEIVSEDQCLYWLFQKKTQSGPVVVIDTGPDRTLCAVLKEQGICYSRVYPGGREELPGMLQEISLSFLESGLTPVKAIVPEGAAEAREEIARSLQIPAEPFEAESAQGRPLPVVLSGARLWGRFPVVSLLPGGQKIRKRGEERKHLVQGSVGALVLFAACFSFLAAGHLFFLKHKAAGLAKQISALAPEVSRLRETADSLRKIEEAARSKERLLLLIQELARRVPASIRLRELQTGEKGLVFLGESPSHLILTETVQAFENTGGIHEVKLEHTRLRRRLNQDFFEFELTAKWKN